MTTPDTPQCLPPSEDPDRLPALGQLPALGRLPEFDRALVVAPPCGGLIAEGKKAALVQARRYYMEEEVLLVVQGKRAIGTLVLKPPRAMTLADFWRCRQRHLVTEDERRRRWPGKTAFYLYEVAEFRPMSAPVAVEHPRGSRPFLAPGLLKIAQ